MSGLRVSTKGFNPRKAAEQAENKERERPAPEAPKPTASEILSKDLSHVNATPRSQYAASSDNAYRQKQQQDILNGRIPIWISPSLISDEVGTDRSDNWSSDEEFEKLVENIEAVGQMEPVRIRAKDPEWVPSHRGDLKEVPEDEDQHFFIQSGRRRLEACKRLGIKVMAFLSTQTDEVERLRENTQRKDLCSFDKYRSVGSVAAFFMARDPKISKAEIARRIGFAREFVTLALDVHGYQDEILKQCADVTSLTSNDLRRAIPLLKAGKEAFGVHSATVHDDFETGVVADDSVSADTATLPSPPQSDSAKKVSPAGNPGRSSARGRDKVAPYKVGRYTVDYKMALKGMTVNIRKHEVTDTQRAQIAEAIEAILNQD